MHHRDCDNKSIGLVQKEAPKSKKCVKRRHKYKVKIVQGCGLLCQLHPVDSPLFRLSLRGFKNLKLRKKKGGQICIKTVDGYIDHVLRNNLNIILLSNIDFDTCREYLMSTLFPSRWGADQFSVNFIYYISLEETGFILLSPSSKLLNHGWYFSWSSQSLTPTTSALENAL